MQYSPKLKTAMEEIKQVLAKHDLGAIIVLHTPGFGEYFVKVDPSYSCAAINEANGYIRVKAKLQEDFNGDKKAWKQKVTDTSNMLHVLSENGNYVVDALMQLSVMVDSHAFR